ncbi:MAG: hypothetical protein WC906_02435 [Parcubacteria group bacterium]|jgi:hypothetical protein
MDINLIFLGITKIFQGFIQSPFFFALKFLLAVYVTVLFADIIMLLMIRGFGADVRTAFRGANVPLVSKSKMRKKWNKIEACLSTGNYSQYKLAIIEADKIIDGIFKSMGLKGNDMIERMKTLNPEQLEAEEHLEEAHKVRNQIINDPSFNIEKAEAKRVLDIYAKFLTENEFME